MGSCLSTCLPGGVLPIAAEGSPSIPLSNAMACINYTDSLRPKPGAPFYASFNWRTWSDVERELIRFVASTSNKETGDSLTLNTGYVASPRMWTVHLPWWLGRRDRATKGMLCMHHGYCQCQR